MAEANVVELFREEPEEELGLRIVGGKDTPLGNIVIQEIVRDSLAARDGRLAPGDHILEVREGISVRYSLLQHGNSEGILVAICETVQHVFASTLRHCVFVVV